ncbi:MAG: metalloregulator ArsR/SmtB family transcription factor [Vampirovibrionales bacterium]|nr:metalloregulator ArsR/SmtB family transcription factor [Vampirovibrionales bacterium]
MTRFMHRKKFDTALKSVSSLFKTLAHPDRLRLIGLLQDGEMGVSQLHQMMGVSQSVVSQHLKLFKLQGMLFERKEGTHVYYSLKNRHLVKLIADAVDLQTEDVVQAKDEEAALLAEMRMLLHPVKRTKRS